jgi:hypothetical protein
MSHMITLDKIDDETLEEIIEFTGLEKDKFCALCVTKILKKYRDDKEAIKKGVKQELGIDT